MSYLTTLRVPPEYQDGFGRLRVSEPYTLHDANFYTTRATWQWAELVAVGGAVTYTTNFPNVNLTSTGAAGSKAVRQSRSYVPYLPGKSYLALLTGILELSGGVANSTERIGIFDDGADKTVNVLPGNGYFFQLAGTALSVVQRSGITGVQVDTVVPQASWNIDPLNGTGKSGITINPGFRQIFFIEMEWLGTGSVMLGLIIDRAFVPCHIFEHANLAGTSAYTNNGSVPVRYEIASTGGGPAAELRQICSTVISEGGYNIFTSRALSLGANMGSTIKAIAPSPSEQPLISLRLKATRNRSYVIPLNISSICTTNGNILITLYKFISPQAYGAGPLTAAVWNAANASTVATFTDISALEVDIAATAVDLTSVTYPYLRVLSFYFPQTTNQAAGANPNDTLVLTADIQGRSDWFVVTARKAIAGAGNEDVQASITWSETS
jgi:hypothetical protein